MKTKLFFSILVLITIAPFAVESGAQAARKVYVSKDQSLVIPAENLAWARTPTGPDVAPADPKQKLQDYDSTLMAITEKFTGTMAAISDAIKRGEITTDQGRELSAEQYQIVQMQFELISLWRQMEEKDSAKTPSVDPRQQNEAVVVALPFPSLQLNPSVPEYLALTPSQVDTIHGLMARGQQRAEPLMKTLRALQERLRSR